MLNLCGIVATILKMATGINFAMSGQFIPDIENCLAVAIFKMAAKIQHCLISSKFDMWVDNDVPTLQNLYRSPFSKWSPQYRTNSTLSDFNDISYVGKL
jgi:hypothetical protein